jgi:hypothetical protein
VHITTTIFFLIKTLVTNYFILLSNFLIIEVKFKMMVDIFECVFYCLIKLVLIFFWTQIVLMLCTQKISSHVGFSRINLINKIHFWFGDKSWHKILILYNIFQTLKNNKSTYFVSHSHSLRICSCSCHTHKKEYVHI